ncbi:hypothetical protein ASC64_17585 [Nocardioides sp. Root122]|uniref:DUF6153 family protein n=1 Tax=Nocardioides TaxID=1839 RepID=UPI0007030057|nr:MULTISPECIES: DUF6153 family protein [Nocardioides]KQV63398.1 hypothetical protein ASC64_17585 [Nocardioides sp. Root122]MCK9826062.1 DUF6153 family protein [Nocardioides cavernae]
MNPVRSTAVGTRRLLRVPTAARPSARTALAAFVAALVVGILGMHALATHGTTPATASASAASSMAMTGGMPAPETTTSGDSHQRQAHAVTSDASTSVADNAADTGSGAGHDMGTMAMLCVVMLAAAALTLLVLLAVRIVRPLLPDAFHPAAAPARAVQWVRGTGPPHVWAFSVIRC